MNVNKIVNNIVISNNYYLNDWKIDTYCKKYEILLIIFTYTIIYPWTMVIHFSNTSIKIMAQLLKTLRYTSNIIIVFLPLTNWTMMCTIRFDWTTFRTLENNLTFSKSHLLYHFFRRITFRHCTLKNKQMKL